eukprot:c38739_g1_i1.p1 GENE.c38739_g1_i1~~c38739_g1_i1.p1  ORF type:complete len:199 (-),score=33.42 c38739_g1_i1:97-663(-)
MRLLFVFACFATALAQYGRSKCTAGNFYVVATDSCLPCPPGFFQSGGTDNTECDACGAGKFQALEGQKKCETCPEGFFTPDSGNPSCLACANETALTFNKLCNEAISTAECFVKGFECDCLQDGRFYNPDSNTCESCSSCGFPSTGRRGGCVGESDSTCKSSAGPIGGLVAAGVVVVAIGWFVWWRKC